MEDLIKALQILLKYGNSRWPTNCTHDILTIMDISPTDVSEEDIKELEMLGFSIDEEVQSFYSFRFGSS